MKTPNLFVGATVLIAAGHVLAGGTVTSGNASLTLVNTPAFSTNLGDATLLTDAGATDQLYKYTWYYRTQFNNTNRFMSSLDTPSESYIGDTATVTYVNAGPGPANQERFDATILTKLIDGAAANQARVVSTCVFRNATASTLTYQVFLVVDLDLSGTPSDDAVSFDTATFNAHQTETSSANFANIQAIAPTRWQVDTGTNIRSLLSGGAGNLSNSVGPVSGDAAVAFQWTLMLLGGQSTALNAAFAINTTTSNCQSPSISQSPASIIACPSGAAAFSVVAAGTGPYSYEWQVQTSPGVWQTMGNDPGPLPCGGGAFSYASPINSPNVNIGIRPCPGNPGAAQHFQIRCMVSNACGSVPSIEATYTICPADFNCDGQRSVGDIFAFLSAWFSQAGQNGPGHTADFNGDNAVTVGDIFAFLTAWFGGC